MATELDPNPTWVSDEVGAERAVAELSRHPVLGYDSEFDEVQIGAESCVGRARVDVFSIAAPAGPPGPIGYTPTRAWVLEGRLLNYGPIVEVLQNDRCIKCIHNQPVDAHAAANQGVRIRGGCNTLSMARWVYPQRANLVSGNYDLDSLCRWRVGFGKVDDFEAIFGYKEAVPYECLAEKKECECGKVGCRKKTGVHATKWPVTVPVTRTKMVRRVRPLSACRSGDPAWGRYLRYAAADAELALILWQMMQIDGRAERVYPWTCVPRTMKSATLAGHGPGIG